jgi:hypothetical protein
MGAAESNVEGVLRGFGMTLDLETGRMRNWYVDREGVKRWADGDSTTSAWAPSSKESANGRDE